MFLAAETGIQMCERWLLMDRTTASFAGAAMSGYLTGGLAASSEWRKVVLSQRSRRGAGGVGGVGGVGSPAGSFLVAAWRSGNLGSALKRLNAAGTRNSIFDATFFGVSHLLTERTELSPGACFALAAASAVVLDYPVDVATKRMMWRRPEEALDGGVWRTSYRLLSSAGAGVYRGLGTKTGEFAISYAITGALSVHVMRVLGGGA